MRFAFDTNVWRYVLVNESFAKMVVEKSLSPLAMPAVVMFELMKMPRTPDALRRITALCDQLSHTTTAPSNEDWALSAKVSRQVRTTWRYDDVGLRRLQNDTLIAVTCARMGWTLVTANKADFQRLASSMKQRMPRVLYVDAPA